MFHRLWMTKDPTAQVEQFSETAERGVYVFFEPTTWDRVKVSREMSPTFMGLRELIAL
jgi:CCR4-NOT transcription complex subunit 2